MLDSEPHLIPGPEHFRVEEIPAYTPCGEGEHLFLLIEKIGMDTERLVERIAKTLGRGRRDGGFAGRKDRHAVTTQWISIHFGDESRVPNIPEIAMENQSVRVLEVGRHRNKLKPGHLSGNRFDLCIANAPHDLNTRLEKLGSEGIRNGFGSQRFGIGGGALKAARALAQGDATQAVEFLVDGHGHWTWGSALPEGFRPGAEGKVLGALRKGADAERALRAGGKPLSSWLATVAQSAIADAVLAEREGEGLLHAPQIGDLVMAASGATFTVGEDEIGECQQRARPGVLDIRTTVPLPGHKVRSPGPEMLEKEKTWSESIDIPWDALAQGPLKSSGDRRPAIIPFLEAPSVHASGDNQVQLRFALPPGAYATTVLAALGIAVPTDRKTKGSSTFRVG